MISAFEIGLTQRATIHHRLHKELNILSGALNKPEANKIRASHLSITKRSVDFSAAHTMKPLSWPYLVLGDVVCIITRPPLITKGLFSIRF